MHKAPHRAQRWRTTLGHTALTRLFVAAISCATLAGLMLPSAPAHSQMRELDRAFTRAQEAYDLLDLQRAERIILDAIALAKRRGLGNDSITASLYIFLGVIRHPEGGDDAARDAFRQAMDIDPNVEIPPDYQTPTLMRLLDESRGGGSGGGGFGNGGNGGNGGGGFEEPYFPPGSTSIVHTPVETGSSGEPMYFEAAVPPSVPLYKVVLHHRRFGENNYQTVEMAPRSQTTFMTTLGGDLVCSSQIDYYIEVLDRSNNPLVATGSASSPLNVFVFGSSGSCGDIVIDDDGDDPPSTGDDDGQSIFLHLAGGGAFGLATGTPIANPDIKINPGLAPAPFHMLAEFGYIINPAIHLSAFFRGQFVLLQGGTELEPMFGAKLRWWFSRDSDFKLFTTFGAGFGFIRHTVDLRPAADFIDTAQHGPLHAGFGFGFAYQFTPNFGLVGDIYAPILFPDVSVTIDATAGFRVSF